MVVGDSESGGGTGEPPDTGRRAGAERAPGSRPLAGLDPRRRWLAGGDTVVTSRTEGDAAVIRVAGELDGVSGPRLWRSVHTALRRGHGLVVVDLTGTGFLDSFGVATLLTLHQRAERRGCRLRVVAGEGQPLRRVLGLAGVDTVLSLCPTVRAALSGAPEAVLDQSRGRPVTSGR